MIKCSICINTYERPTLLTKLLESLLNQILPGDVEIEIIVVDNGPRQLGKIVVSEINVKYDCKIRYFTQPEKNISLTRNLAVANSSGNYILFIDDDGYADKNWIKTMLACAIKYDADAVFGRVIPYFEENIPDWLKNGKFFERECAPSGNNPKFTRTGNCLIKANVLKSIEGPFDSKYGITGGSDTHLFTALLSRGAKYISCYEGIVYDFVHPERANYKWLVQRSFRTGNTFTRRALEFSNYSTFLRIKLLFKALIFSLVCSILICLNIFSKKLRTFWTLKLVGNIGHILAIFNYHYVEYK